MRRTRDPKMSGRTQRRNAHVAVAVDRARQLRSARGKRARGTPFVEQEPYSPPEDWYEPRDEDLKKDPYSFEIIVQDPGSEYRHVLTPDDIRKRLRQLPPAFVSVVDVVQLSGMTRKKELFPCYGMQWGTNIYLYPVESDRIERHTRPPKPAELQEAKMYGGRWVQLSEHRWDLIWTEEAIRNYYLNNILIHELGHLLDERNTNYAHRERFAEWFALEYGYKRSQQPAKRKRRKKPKRRHHRR